MLLNFFIAWEVGNGLKEILLSTMENYVSISFGIFIFPCKLNGRIKM